MVKYMLDYATAESTATKYNQNAKGQEYCALFTTDNTERLTKEVAQRTGNKLKQGGHKLDGTEMGMNAFEWGKTFQSDFNEAGININVNVDLYNMSDEERKDAVRRGLIYPGMTFESRQPVTGHYHTGFIESINPDLTVNTIEGNTHNGVVGSNRHPITFQNFVSMTDSVLKAWYIAKDTYEDYGLDINDFIYH